MDKERFMDIYIRWYSKMDLKQLQRELIRKKNEYDAAWYSEDMYACASCFNIKEHIEVIEYAIKEAQEY